MVTKKSDEIWRGKPIQYLIDAWTKGTNASEIGDYYNANRDTVRRKAISLGLKPRNSKKIARANSIKFNIRKEPTEPKKPRSSFHSPYKIYTEFPNSNAIGLDLLQLKSSNCRFPIGTGGDDPYRYCGAPIPEGSPVPYCEVCKAIMYVPSKYQVESKEE